MTTNELELWQKIKHFQFDKENVKLTFAKRLARENSFSDSFTKEIIEEYRKFIFLCCISKQQITPSHYVDLVWHLHLTYTKSYWIDLCKNTIGKEIHHNPTEGGKTEDNKYKNYYNYTTELYKVKFHECPPIKIWQNDIERFKNRIVNIDRNKNWVIQKPFFTNLKPHFRIFGILTVFSLIFYSCTQTDSGVFSILFFVVIFGIIIYSISNSTRNKQNNSSSDSTSSGCGTSSDGHSKHSNDDNDSDSSDGDSSDGGDGGSSGCGGGCGGGGD
jgi:hypothetical protein